MSTFPAFQCIRTGLFTGVNDGIQCHPWVKTHPLLFHEAEISQPAEEQNMCNATFVMLQMFSVIYHIFAAFIKIFLF